MVMGDKSIATLLVIKTLVGSLAISAWHLGKKKGEKSPQNAQKKPWLHSVQ